MFKTIHDCRLDLVSYSVAAVEPEEITLLKDSSATGARLLADVNEQNLDFMPCSAARVSFGNEDKTGDDVAKDVKLMKYLADHQHMTPFEYQHATFLIEVPLFIRSQIHRHRTFAYNEISRRYTDENLEFWAPDSWRAQSKSNKQASSDATLSQYLYTEEEDGVDVSLSYAYEQQAMNALSTYNDLLAHGVAREQARSVLPQSLLTKFYMGGTLRNWAHFIALRNDSHAQYEVQIVARRIAAKLKELWPNSSEALGL